MSENETTSNQLDALIDAIDRLSGAFESIADSLSKIASCVYDRPFGGTFCHESHIFMENASDGDRAIRVVVENKESE